MTCPGDEFDELRGLLDALCDESITADQVRRLEGLILARPDAEAYYVQFMSLHADLSRRFAGKPAPVGRPLQDRVGPVDDMLASRPAVAQTVRGRRRRWGGAAAGLAALAAAILVALGLFYPRPAPDGSGEVVGERTDRSVATLHQAPEAVWDAAGPKHRAGDPLYPGKLRLKAGVAHIEFYSGATVILEGPAEFELISRTRAFCTRGKLRAIVPPQAQGFTIGSPTLDLVDRGTEFGLNVGAGDATEVHVFQGKVELFDAGAGGGAAPRQELTTGQAARRDGPGDVRPIAPDPAAFQTTRGLAEQARRETDRQWQAWEATRNTLARDPSVVAFYSFEPDQPWSRTLADLSRGRAEPRDGAVVGCSWASGRWPGKLGLEFKRVSDRVRTTIPGEFDSITLSAWVRVDALPNVNNALLMADGWDPGGLHWQVSHDGMLILGIKGPPGRKNAHYHAENVFTADRLGRWAHLAVTYDRDSGWVTHYLDGQVVVRLPVLFDIPLRFGDAELGNWNNATRPDSVPIRHFSGCMDEVVVFSRALAEEEVGQLYEGRPPG